LSQTLSHIFLESRTPVAGFGKPKTRPVITILCITPGPSVQNANGNFGRSYLCQFWSVSICPYLVGNIWLASIIPENISQICSFLMKQ
jgi:hypothetical protein